MTEFAIRAGWVVTSDPAQEMIEDGVVVVRDGTIAWVGAFDDAQDVLPATVHSFPRHLIHPGLINAHTHVGGTVFKGMTEDHANGFYGIALPMEDAFDEPMVRALSRLGAAETLLAGSTILQDMYFYPNTVAEAALDFGMRAQVANKVLDVDLGGIQHGEWQAIPGEFGRRFERNVQLYDDWNGAGEGRISVRFGIHAADTMTPEHMRTVVDEANRRTAGLHIHAAQSKVEVAHMRELHGKGSIEYIHEQGVLTPRTVVAHAVYVDDHEIDLLAQTGTTVAHCPVILAKRGHFAPVSKMYERGVRVALGTDWVSMDPWEAMRSAIEFPRVIAGTIEVRNARNVLMQMTQVGADALGIGAQLGSLTAGKRADIVFVDIDQPHLSPMFDPITVLVYNGRAGDVTHVMVDGRFVVRDRRLNLVDQDEVVADGNRAARELWRRRGLSRDNIPWATK